MTARKTRQKRGSIILEFLLCTLVLIPLFLGTFAIGMNLGRSIQATQVSRDAGHMYVRFVDFSLPQNQAMIVRLAKGLGMDPNNDGNPSDGRGVVILTKIFKIGNQECLDGGVSLASCQNNGQAVITQRIVIGNSSVRASSIGTPPGSIVGSDGNITPTNYLQHTGAQSVNFGNILNLNAGEYAYVSEAYFQSPDYDLGAWTGTGVYARTIF